MASRPEKEAMALSGVANFLQAYLQAKKDTQKQKREDERFNATLAAKRLEDQQAAEYKRYAAYNSLQDDLRRVSADAQDRLTYDANKQVISRAPPLLTEEEKNLRSAQLQDTYQALFGQKNGIRYEDGRTGYAIQDPNLVANRAVFGDLGMANRPAGLFPLSPSQPAPTSATTPDATQTEPTTPQNQAYKTNTPPTPVAKEAIKGKAGDGASASPQQERDVYKAVAEYEKIQTESDYVISTLSNLQKLAPVARGGMGGAVAQKFSSATGIGAETESFKNTAALINGLKGMAVQLLKPTFGGNISDGEREEVMKISGALETMQPEERQAAMSRMIEIATLAAQRAKDVAVSLSENVGVPVKWQDRTNRKPISATTSPGQTDPSQAPKKLSAEELRKKYDF